MKSTFKLLAFLLALVMLVTALTACPSSKKDDDGTTEGETSTEEETTAGEPKIQAEELHIIEKVTDETHEYKATGKGKDGNTYGTDYQIVYSAVTTPEEFAFVKQLRDNIKSATGVMIPLRIDDEFDDEPETLRQDKEIIVGSKTNRQNEYTEKFDYQKGYSIFVSYDRLVILTGSTYGISAAVNDFIKDQFGQDPRAGEISKVASSAWTIKSTYGKDLLCASEHFPEIGAELKDYKITYDGISDFVKRPAFALSGYISNNTGVSVSVSYDNPSSDPKAKEFVIREDTTLTNGDYKIEVAKNGCQITLKAGDYYGIEAAARYFKGHRKAGCFDEIVPGAVLTGNYTESLSGYEKSTKYAFEKQGDIRVMYANVLFNNTAGTDDGSDSWQVPTGDRNLLQIEMFKLYQPDVLGCQEFNNSKRADALLYSGEKDQIVDLAQLLDMNGFKEAVDPRVHNSVKTNFSNEVTTSDGYRYYSENNIGKMEMTDPILGKLTYTSYASLGGGGTTVSLDDGKTSFQTFYNNTPLFYNTKTTDFVTGAYYWYQNHEDGQSNGSGDCGSKAMTWGLFKDKETENQYIVISTHMCTRSNTVRALEAMEMIDYVEGLVTKYDVPIFLGGDMNGTLNGGYNILLFMERLDCDDETIKTDLIEKEPDDRCIRKYSDVTLEKYQDHIDFVDLQTWGLGGVENTEFDPENSNGMTYVSTVSSGHGYPEYNKKMGGTMQPGHTFNLHYSTHSIDRIFWINGGENGQPVIFGYVVDNYSESSSDHFPMFVDYNFGTIDD